MSGLTRKDVELLRETADYTEKNWLAKMPTTTRKRLESNITQFRHIATEIERALNSQEVLDLGESA